MVVESKAKSHIHALSTPPYTHTQTPKSSKFLILGVNTLQGCLLLTDTKMKADAGFRQQCWADQSEPALMALNSKFGKTLKLPTCCANSLLQHYNTVSLMHFFLLS